MKTAIIEILAAATSIKDIYSDANKAASLTLNKTGTLAKNISISSILRDVTLQPSYVKKHLKVTARASPSNLRVVISANNRATLLARYANFKTQKGYSISVNRTGGYRNIPGAKMITLRGSGVRTIAVRNKDYAKILKRFINKGDGPTSKKRAKLSRALSKGLQKPYGMSPLHSRSINQMFQSVRDDITPEVNRFMGKEFISDFRKVRK